MDRADENCIVKLLQKNVYSMEMITAGLVEKTRLIYLATSVE